MFFKQMNGNNKIRILNRLLLSLHYYDDDDDDDNDDDKDDDDRDGDGGHADGCEHCDVCGHGNVHNACGER